MVDLRRLAVVVGVGVLGACVSACGSDAKQPAVAEEVEAPRALVQLKAELKAALEESAAVLETSETWHKTVTKSPAGVRPPFEDWCYRPSADPTAGSEAARGLDRTTSPAETFVGSLGTGERRCYRLYDDVISHRLVVHTGSGPAMLKRTEALLEEYNVSENRLSIYVLPQGSPGTTCGVNIGSGSIWPIAPGHVGTPGKLARASVAEAVAARRLCVHASVGSSSVLELGPSPDGANYEMSYIEFSGEPKLAATEAAFARAWSKRLVVNKPLVLSATCQKMKRCYFANRKAKGDSDAAVDAAWTKVEESLGSQTAEVVCERALREAAKNPQASPECR